MFVEERNGSWASSYLFNAKELDEETGLYYYGARYLDPTGAMWLSVDPLQEKYPGMNPYNYCAGNPVKMVDPDGGIILFAEGCSDEFKKSFAAAIFPSDNVTRTDHSSGDWVRVKNSTSTIIIE